MNCTVPLLVSTIIDVVLITHTDLYSGCTDIYECTVGYMGALTRGTHTCVRTSDSGEVCYNYEGGYSCGPCDVGGAEKREGQDGTILSHTGHGSSDYDNYMNKEWYIKVALGYNVQLTIHEFGVSITFNKLC